MDVKDMLNGESPARASNGTNGTNKNPVICVFCGASPGTSPSHMTAATALAQTLHAQNATLVYGAGTTGIMGEVARTMVSLARSASHPDPSSVVHGFIPKALQKHEQKLFSEGGRAKEDGRSLEEREKAREYEYGRMTVVESMHERKHLMSQLVYAGGPGSGFVALSGGFGTLEELMEITTWNQLSIHKLPIVVFNVDGFWDGLFRWRDEAVERGFVNEQNREIFVEARSAEEVVEKIQNYKVAEARLELDWELAG